MEFEDIISWTLRIGVVISACLIIIGIAIGVIYPASAPIGAWSINSKINTSSYSFGDIIYGIQAGSAYAYILLGMVVLAATPVARVVLSIISFAISKNKIYTFITIIVLLDILIALFIIPSLIAH